MKVQTYLDRVPFLIRLDHERRWAFTERCWAFGVLFGFVFCSVNASSVFSVRCSGMFIIITVHVRCFVQLRLLHVVLFGVLFGKVGRVEFCSMLCLDLVFCSALSLAKRVLFIVLFGERPISSFFFVHVRCSANGVRRLVFLAERMFVFSGLFGLNGCKSRKYFM